MTRATLYYNGGRPQGFEIAGHSGYASEGEDIVCAAVSSAARMCVNGITDAAGGAADVSQDAHNGRLSLRLIERDEQVRVRCELFIKALRLELGMIMREYPRHLSVEIKEEP